MKLKQFCIATTAVALLGAGVMAQAADWTSFVIRASNTGSIQPVITDNGDGSKTFTTSLGGQKAGWGTNDVNGSEIGDITSISIVRDANAPGYGPYMNFWVTDGAGHYAILANEPSNPEWNLDSAYNTTWDVLKNKTLKVYETNGEPFRLPYVLSSGQSYKFGDFANYVIATPTTNWGGTGAPDDINATAYTAYGFNWVFGDSQNNYLASIRVSNPTIEAATPAPVPEPGTIVAAFSILGPAGLMFRRRKA